MLCIAQLSEAMHSRIPVAPLVGLGGLVALAAGTAVEAGLAVKKSREKN